MPFFKILVPEDFSQVFRLDKFISTFYEKSFTRSQLKNCAQKIFVDGKPAKLSTLVSAGKKIEIEWQKNLPENIIPQNIPLKIVYEDENTLVIDKAQGMVVHPANGNWEGTLVNALLFRFEKKAQKIDFSAKDFYEKCRPGIVHRLDKETSGLIITAKNEKSAKWLQEQFQKRKVVKDYIAIVVGSPPKINGVIKTKIARDEKNRKKFKAFPFEGEKGKTAITFYKKISQYGNYSLLRLRLKTGRTHQIRVHLNFLGCPILGDSLYGFQKKDLLFPHATLCLHSYFLKIKLFEKNEFSSFKTEVPKRFLEILKILKNESEKK